VYGTGASKVLARVLRRMIDENCRSVLMTSNKLLFNPAVSYQRAPRGGREILRGVRSRSRRRNRGGRHVCRKRGKKNILQNNFSTLRCCRCRCLFAPLWARATAAIEARLRPFRSRSRKGNGLGRGRSLVWFFIIIIIII